MARSFFRWMIVMGLLGALFGCDREVSLNGFPSHLIFETYEPTGALVSKRIVGANDPVYQKLLSVLNSHHAGWQKSFVSYKTGPYIFRDERVIIRIYADMIVIDIFSAGDSTSMKKSVPGLLQMLGLPAVDKGESKGGDKGN